MNKTSIEWTDYTWNPIRARNTRSKDKRTGTFCTRISPGCKNCYASVINRRFGTGDEYEVPNLAHHEFFIDERILEEPLRRKKPARIFVGDMFDLFHEAIPDSMLLEVFGIMAAASHHTFQLLTKRADRLGGASPIIHKAKWQPLPNVWLGVSVEDQHRADERIPLLFETPAAVRFLSVEPMLESIMLFSTTARVLTNIDWIICGGESGPGARPFNPAWAKSLLEQCRAAGVPFFMKQLGSKPLCQDCQDHETHFCGVWKIKDRKGGDPSEWPESLRVREFPGPKAEVVHA